MVKVTHQGQSKISTSLQILSSLYSLQAGGLHSTEMLPVVKRVLLTPWVCIIYSLSRVIE